MRSDFINKRFIQNRRRNVSDPPKTEERELILLPEFDTFLWWNSSNGGGDDRWDVENVAVPDNEKTILPISPLNPWNDGSDNPEVGGGGTIGGFASATRTPARSLLGFKVVGIPTDASILSAELRLTVNTKKNWD